MKIIKTFENYHSEEDLKEKAKKNFEDGGLIGLNPDEQEDCEGGVIQKGDFMGYKIEDEEYDEDTLIYAQLYSPDGHHLGIVTFTDQWVAKQDGTKEKRTVIDRIDLK